MDNGTKVFWITDSSGDLWEVIGLPDSWLGKYDNLEGKTFIRHISEDPRKTMEWIANISDLEVFNEPI